MEVFLVCERFMSPDVFEEAGITHGETFVPDAGHGQQRLVGHVGTSRSCRHHDQRFPGSRARNPRIFASAVAERVDLFWDESRWR